MDIIVANAIPIIYQVFENCVKFSDVGQQY